MKKQSLLTPGARVGFPLIMTLVAICQAAAQSENFSAGRREALTPLIFQAAGPDEALGPDPAPIQSIVDAFRAKLGPDNGNQPGQTSGRREINWDGGGVAATTPLPPETPFVVFLNTRGALFTTPGDGFTQAPPNGAFPNTGLAGLFNNPTYGQIFTVFSALRLFTPVGSNITKGKFFIPGTNGATPANVRGFGAVFTDVDRQDSGGDKHRRHRGASTVIEYFAANGRLLFRGVVPASPGDGSLSFFGIVFDEPLIAKIRITTGNSAPGPNDNDRRDIVMMDDFIYSEPQSTDSATPMSSSDDVDGDGSSDETDGSSSDETESSAAAADESTTTATSQNQTLTVINGSVSGTGAVVTVTADDPPAGQQFAGWTGDIEILARSDLSPTTATVPSTPVQITATYEDSSAPQP